MKDVGRPALEYRPHDPRGEWLLARLAIVGLFALILCFVVILEGGVYVGRTTAAVVLGVAIIWLGISKLLQA